MKDISKYKPDEFVTPAEASLIYAHFRGTNGNQGTFRNAVDQLRKDSRFCIDQLNPGEFFVTGKKDDAHTEVYRDRNDERKKYYRFSAIKRLATTMTMREKMDNEKNQLAKAQAIV
jgi:hypothetical protein